MYGRLCAWLVKHRYVFFFCSLSFSVIIVLSATALLLWEEVLSWCFFFGERWFGARMERDLHRYLNLFYFSVCGIGTLL